MLFMLCLFYVSHSVGECLALCEWLTALYSDDFSIHVSITIIRLWKSKERRRKKSYWIVSLYDHFFMCARIIHKRAWKKRRVPRKIILYLLFNNSNLFSLSLYTLCLSFHLRRHCLLLCRHSSESICALLYYFS